MGVLANIRALVGRGTVRYYGVPVEYAGVEGMSADRLYKTQPALKTVVDYLARNIAQLPLKAYRFDGEGRARDREGAMARLVARPNPDSTRYELIRDTVSDFKLYDFALWVVGRDDASPSGWQIRHVPATWIVESKGTGFAYDRFVFADGAGRRVEVGAESCVVFHGYCPSDPREGSSAVRALKETIREQVEAQRFRRSTWQNAMRITGYIKRPPTVEPWDEPARERFATEVRAMWGKKGERAGGTPVFEDGMEYHPVEFNTREKDWAQGVQLSREEVAAAFHVNPSLIWHTEGQTYASARDNARALYADTLAPDLEFIASRATMRLGEITGEQDVYLEFDLQAKLQGSFEEQVSSLQTSVGAPFMTRAEARSRMNLPFVEGTDELIVPLNVIEGGLASPTDTDPTTERYSSARAANTRSLEDMWCACGCKSGGEVVPDPKDARPARERKAAGDPTEGDADELAEVYRRFFERQARSVEPRAVNAGDPGDSGGTPAWWDGERWDRELADDLYPVVLRQADAAGERAVAALWPDDPSRRYAKRATAKYLRRMCESRARADNEATLRHLRREIAADGAEKGLAGAKGIRDAIRKVFAFAAGVRSARSGRSLAGATSSFATVEAARQNARGGEEVYKTWRTTSDEPRSSHAAMNGETVRYGQAFSNGMERPGEFRPGQAQEVAYCQCVLDVEVRKDARGRDERIQRRIENATVIGEDIHSMTAAEVANEAQKWDDELAEIAERTPNLWDSRNAYRKYAEYVEGKATKASITIDDFAKIEGKELQIAQWFSNIGVEIHFRNHNDHDNKSDVGMLGMLFDFKRFVSKNPKQIGGKIREKLDTQGPGFVIDLSISPITLEDGLRQAANLLENERVERILVIKDARVIELRK